MQLKLSASVHFANGDPAPNVTIRIFDKDASGKDDDDLTISPGLSNAKGHFSLTYEPMRYLDYHNNNINTVPDKSGGASLDDNGVHLPDLGDIYLPYLKFDYTFNGQIYTHTASLGVFQSKFYLPENPPVNFLPSVHGFRFANSFPGYFLPFSTPAFMTSRKVSAKYGLCGGMCAAAYDFALAGRPIPGFSDVPKQGTRLHRFLFRRQMDSLGGLGLQAIKVAQWTSLPDDTPVGTMRRTADEMVAIRQMLDQQNLVVLALIYVRATSLRELSRLVFDNHQVLAYGYSLAPSGAYTLRVYDPNLPARDDVTLHAEPVALEEDSPSTGHQLVWGLKSTELLGGSPYRNIRGFFTMPYSPVKPPRDI